ncbi:MAG: M3 family metallopeptidase [Thermoanaerobaculia bacterium]
MKRLFLICFTAISLSAFGAEPAERTTIPILDAPTLTLSCRQVILDTRDVTAKLAAVPIDSVTPDLLSQWDDASMNLENVVGPAAILSNVHPDKRVRDAAEDCLVKVTTLQTEIFQNEDLYKRVSALKTATPVQAKFRQDLLDAFDDSGVSLAKDKRARAREIVDRAALLSQEFEKNIRDNNTRLTFTLAEAKGLPQSYIDRVKDGKGNIAVGFDYPDFYPFMQSVESEPARRRYYVAFQSRGGARNLAILDELTALRKELATLYGYPSFAAYVTKRNMVENPETVDKFLNSVRSTVIDVEKRDLGELRKLKAQTNGTPLAQTTMNRWDVPYWRERLRQQRYAVDEESTRKYFPTKAAQDWMLDITSRLYGVTFEPATVPVWHPDVQYFDLKDTATGAFLGGVYFDLYPREGKFKHAASWPVRGVSTRVGRKPVSVLVTNFDRTGLTTGEVETFFHEFGHVMHGVLSETVYNQHAGTSVQRDFVEAPSQIYEEWARNPQSIALLKAHCSGCPEIDAALLKRLHDARNFGRGIDYERQHEYAAFDMSLAGASPENAMATWKKIEGGSPLGFVDGTAFPGTFAHIAGGYASGYYGYMWAEVIGLDMLSAWRGSLLDPAVGMKFRKTVLARGGEEPAKAIVERFLGRPVSSDAFFAEITGKRE